MAANQFGILAVILIVHSINCWQIPSLPANKRAQYYLIYQDGGYKYGYDTGVDHYAQQAADASNEVEGSYSYTDAAGNVVDQKYKAGKQGFVPLGAALLAKTIDGYSPALPSDTQTSGDASYSFSFDTDNYKRTESSDPNGNIRGRYSYSNDAGTHNLNYIAGVDTGFIAQSGSLSIPNGLGVVPSRTNLPPASSSDESNTGDSSYNFNIDTPEYQRQEASDAQGNVKGSFSYSNSEGTHDLSYIAGAEVGFKPIGGSLASPNGLKGSPITAVLAKLNTPAASPDYTISNRDGSYSFSYKTGDQEREESSDPLRNVRGRYSYMNPAGVHDLSYIAGSETGFVATGGSLAAPNGLGASNPTISAKLAQVQPDTTRESSVASNDGSYSFSYNTGDQEREESSDPSGNVKGRYSYQNSAGVHDLSYIAGADTGFVATGGSLSVPNGLGASGSPQFRTVPVTTTVTGDSEGTTIETQGDGSYSFLYKTGDQAREESADASGNVKGRYSYTNSAGSHDLSYKAGAETGFVATGGSLSVPNGLGASGSPQFRTASVTSVTDDSEGTSSIESPGDGSYSFSYKTGDQAREESADTSGNVKGRYSYTNSAGTHDLSYKAGAETGFVATGGSLSVPNGLGASGNPEFKSVTTTVADDSEGTTSIDTSGDGSYSFSYKTDDHEREESADASGNVKGRYSYTNSAGSHDLSYKAGAETGFITTGGSLALPNGLGGSGNSVTFRKIPVAVINDEETTSEVSSDGSYSFSFKTVDQNREESSDANGNVKGRYSYTNSAGSHDLSYIAGSETGFVATGGSLAVPNGLTSGATPQLSAKNIASDSTDSSATDDESGDASYSFSYKTDNHEREESSDAAGNVKGRYSYTNPAGVHDLSYTAGDGAGFVVTGGSLATPGLGAAARTSAAPANVEESPQDDEANTGDASYSFTIDTDEYQRKESSDASGNVQGEYSYKNNAGTHGLKYVAGSATGFQPTSGSLSLPNGLSPVLGRNTIYGSSVPANVVPFAKIVPITHVNDGITVKSFLEPGNVKFGYIFEA